MGCPSPCHLGASVRSTPQQELSARHPATLRALFSAIPSLPPLLPPSFSALKAKHLFPADGKLRLHGLNKYILASKNRSWKGWWEEIKGSEARRVESVAKYKKFPRGMFGKRAKEHPLVWWWLRVSLSPFLSLSSPCLTHSTPIPAGPRLLIEARFGAPAPADPRPPVDTHHAGGTSVFVRMCVPLCN